MKITIIASENEVNRIKRSIFRELANDYAYELVYLKQSKIVAYGEDGSESDDGFECVILYTDDYILGLDDIPF